MVRKKPASSTHTEHPIPVACPTCETLERRYDNTIGQSRELLECRFQSLREKVRELHRWQENRDEAIEDFYAHKRMHRIQIVKARRARKIA